MESKKVKCPVCGSLHDELDVLSFESYRCMTCRTKSNSFAFNRVPIYLVSNGYFNASEGVK